MRVITTCNDFEPNSTHDDSRLKKFHQTMQTSDEPPWIFINGYTNICSRKSIINWKKDSQDGFRTAVKFIFKHVIPAGREIIVCLVLSDETDLLLECDDLIYNHNFVFIGQDNDTMTSIIRSLVKKQVIIDTGESKTNLSQECPGVMCKQRCKKLRQYLHHTNA